MLAAVLPKIKSPWQIREIPTPEPGPTEVLIRIRASGLCYTDVHLSESSMFPLPFPAVLGHEPAGEIVALGSAVTTRKIGDRVGTNTLQSTCGRCEFCQKGKIVDCPEQKLLMIHQSGSHAEYMLSEASATLLLPDTMSFETAAPLLCAGNTVWSGLSIAKPQAEDRVAVWESAVWVILQFSTRKQLAITLLQSLDRKTRGL